MDPITIMLLASTAIGIGTSLFGTKKSMDAAGQQNEAQRASIGLEEQQNVLRHEQMVLDSNRQSIQDYRNAQRLSAMSLDRATNQGAQKGSGLQGGLAQVQDQSLWNQMGISQNREIGEGMFSLDSQLNAQKIAMARASSSMAKAHGIQAVGAAITSSAGAFSRIGSGFGPPKPSVQTPSSNPFAYTGSMY